MYKVVNNWLFENNTPLQKVSINEDKYSRGNNVCDYIIYHYTASTSASSAHNTYKNGKVSWHITIDRDGTLYQLLDFRKRAWHAGISNWVRPNGEQTGGLNSWSIGIEFINAGPLSFSGCEYKTWFGSVISPFDVYTDENGKHWQKYTTQQIKRALDITPVLCKQYKCLDVMAHSEISPRRKQDTGPAFDECLLSLKTICKNIRSGV